MDDERFDALTMTFAGTRSRRHALATGIAAITQLLGGTAFGSVKAKKSTKPRKAAKGRAHPQTNSVVAEKKKHHKKKHHKKVTPPSAAMEQADDATRDALQRDANRSADYVQLATYVQQDERLSQSGDAEAWRLLVGNELARTVLFTPFAGGEKEAVLAYGVDASGAIWTLGLLIRGMDLDRILVIGNDGQVEAVDPNAVESGSLAAPRSRGRAGSKEIDFLCQLIGLTCPDIDNPCFQCKFMCRLIGQVPLLLAKLGCKGLATVVCGASGPGVAVCIVGAWGICHKLESILIGGVCDEGVCQITGSCCPGVTEWDHPDWRYCDGRCTDASQDPNNCGRCDNACGAGEVCGTGQCLCVEPPCGSPIKLRVEASVQDPVTGKPLSAPPFAVVPTHPTISAEITLTKGNSQPIVRTVQVTHDNQSHAYIGILDLGTSVPEGQYTVAVKFRDRVRTLREQAPGPVALQQGTTASVRVALTPGDANDDNALTSADCDRISSCYTFPGFPPPCSGDTLKAADIDDDGVVDEFDVNLCGRARTAATCKALDQSCSRTSDCCAKPAIFQMELVCQQGRCAKASSPTTVYQFVNAWGTHGSGNRQFDGAAGVAVDAAGNIYVTDDWNARVQKLSSTGTFLAKWGTPGAGDTQFDSPGDIAVDAVGNIYVADRGNFRIQKINSAGSSFTNWGTYGTADGQFAGVQGVAVDAAGNVYVADSGNFRIQKFSSSGDFLTKWGTPGTGNGQFDSPWSVAVDGDGNVYVLDIGGDEVRIEKFAPNAQNPLQYDFLTSISKSFGDHDGQFENPEAIAVDNNGNIYVADWGNDRIQKFSSSGAFLTTWGTYGNDDGHFSGPSDVAVDGDGNVFVADTFNDRIQKFAPVGDVRMTAKSAKGAAADGRIGQIPIRRRNHMRQRGNQDTKHKVRQRHGVRNR